MEEPVSQDSILCSSCWIGLHRLFHWPTLSASFCCVQIGGISGKQKVVLYCWCCNRKRCALFSVLNRRSHNNDSCRKMASYEPKISSYSASSRYSLYHLCSIINCVVAGRIFSLLYSVKALSALQVIFLLAAASSVVVTAFSYFRVFRIIRHHQSQVQANQNAIDIEKYKKADSHNLYFLAKLCSLSVLHRYFIHKMTEQSSMAAINMLAWLWCFLRLFSIPCFTIVEGKRN